MKPILLVFICLLSLSVKSQIITTVVGTGVAGYSGEGIPANSSKIINPGQGCFDNLGNFYLPQGSGNRVSKISQDGILNTIIGDGIVGSIGDGGLATTARVNMPNTVALDSSGNIYVCDAQNCKIRRIDRVTGIVSTVVGNGVPGFSGDGHSATNAQLFYPAGICFDNKGNLYIGDGSRRIRKVNTLGVITTFAGIGDTGISGDGGPATAAKSGSGALCTDKIGNLYIADCAVNESRIAKIDTFGIITTFAGTIYNIDYNGDGIPATMANINPVGMAFDKFGNLIFADWYNHRVRKIDTNGIISTIAGTGTSGYGGDGSLALSAIFNMPQGIAINMCGDIFVSDNNNARVRKITMPPTLTIPTISLSVAGTAMPLGSTVTVNATVANAGSSYMIRWQNRGVEFATTTVPVVTYTKMPGVDTITARVVSTASYGCYDSTTSAPKYVSDSSTGVRSTGVMGGVYVYPNPANKQVTIMAGERMHSVAISNMQGQELLRYAPNATSYTVAIDMLPPGVYMVRVNDVWVGKVVKE